MENLLKEMEAYAAANHVPIITQQGRKVFCDIISKAKPHRALEIGTAIGYSTLLLAEYGAPDLSITTLELDDGRAGLAQAYIDRSPYRERIVLYRGDAAEHLTRLKGGYDFVFIDAAKGQYPHYLESVLPLLADQAVIVADNVLFRGYVKAAVKPPRRYKTIVNRLRQYIEMTTHHQALTTKIYENGDGLAVSYYDRNRQEGERFEKA